MIGKMCKNCQQSEEKVLHLVTSNDFEEIRQSAFNSLKKKNILRSIRISSFSVAIALLYNVIKYSLMFNKHLDELERLEGNIITLLFIFSIIIWVISSLLYVGKSRSINPDRYSTLFDNIQSVKDKSVINLSDCKCIVGTWKMSSTTFESEKQTTGTVQIKADSFGFYFKGPLIGDSNIRIARVSSDICQYFPKDGTLKATYDLIVNDKDKIDEVEKSNFIVNFKEDGKTLEGRWATLDASSFRSGKITLERSL